MKIPNGDALNALRQWRWYCKTIEAQSQGDAKACTWIEWRNGSVPVGVVENASKGRLGTLATRVTESFQLRLDIFEHIKSMEITPLNGEQEEEDFASAMIFWSQTSHHYNYMSSYLRLARIAELVLMENLLEETWMGDVTCSILKL
jgi:hypothetical protein